MQVGIEKLWTRIILAWISSFFLLLATSQAIAATECDALAGRMVSVEGSVEKRHESAQGWQPVRQGDAICAGDFVHAGRYSRAGIFIEGADTLIRLDENTTFQLVAPEQKPRTLIELLKGAAHFISRVRHSLEIRTPFVSSYVDGTEFLVRVDDGQTTVVLYEGDVLASNDAGSQRMAPGQAITARKGEAPRFSTVIRPRDAVQWTLHYPHLFSALVSDSRRPAEEQLGDAFKDALSSMHQGFTAAAFKRLDEVPHAAGFTLYHIYRAGLLLTVGRVEEADKQLARALKLKKHKGAALSLKSLIALSRNEKQQAMDLATQAVAAEANSAVAYLALSYAQQAHFDLDGALASGRKAVELAPSDPYAHARLAELLLSTGDLKGALAAAQQAVNLDAEIALGQTMLGFAHLTRVELDRAKAALEKAAALDQSDPLPRLGLGLALIREGRLEAGRRELEIATVLDPQNALVRSYMGKAYYEERRDSLATTQYDLAKQIDPQDPTPWYYHALLLHQQGQTVEALHNLLTSAELNDNRAVYRSKLLLDKDEAARSAGLGQVYRDLNFEHLALIEGWTSVEGTPEEHAGHRLLADTYTHLPRHEVARVSELLQAQLLQPVNSTPIQPTMAETALYVPNGMGPSDPAYNEYATLFHRDGARAQVSAAAGSNDMLGEEIILSGVKGNVSFSLGQYHYDTDGYRDNFDLEHDIWTGFIQANLSEKTSVQAEVRRSSREYGDPFLHFYESQESPNIRNDDDQEVVRLGLHHRFNPRSELIASVIHVQGDEFQENAVNAGALDILSESKTDTESWSAELRHLQRWESVRVTAGLGYLDQKEHSDINIMADPLPVVIFPGPIPPRLVIDAPPFPLVQTIVDADVRQANAYLYSWIDLGQALTLNVGLSYDDYDARYHNEQQFNPKLGLTWRASPQTTFRAAAFRTLHRPLATSQTIEPTEVAGFNQFFDGLNGEQVWRYGMALDHRFSEALAGGVELSRRERTVPGVDLNTLALSEDNRDEELGHAYLYWVPTDRTAVALEYLYERVFEAIPESEDLEDTTHRFPLTFSYFHPSGLNGSLRATYVRQYGEFELGMGNDMESFWHLDLSLDYRLPKHRGQLSLGVRNLLDEEFGYHDRDPNYPVFMGDQTISLRASLNFQ